MNFYQRIQELAKKKGVSFKQIEKELNYPTNTLYNYKSKDPSGQRLIELSKYFGVSIDFLLGRKDNELVGLGKFIDELNRRYDDVISLSFMNSDFFGFCIVIEEIALNSLRIALGTNMTSEIISEYSSTGFKRQEYLSSFKEQIDDKTLKALEIPHLKETILEQEKQIASKYFV